MFKKVTVPKDNIVTNLGNSLSIKNKKMLNYLFKVKQSYSILRFLDKHTGL